MTPGNDKEPPEVYHKQTQPIVQHYAQQGKHHQIDGVGTIEEVASKYAY